MNDTSSKASGSNGTSNPTSAHWWFQHFVANHMLDITRNDGNPLTTRRKWLNPTPDDRRDYDHEYGHPKISDLGAEFYQNVYDLNAIGARVVEVYPKESWQVQPSIYEEEDTDTTTPFEQAIKDISQRLRGEDSYFVGEEGDAIWEYLLRADIQSGIGHYGCILLGIDDGRELKEPALLRASSPGRSKVGATTTSSSPTPYYSPSLNARDIPRQLLFLRVFPEYLARISTYETDPRNPRYGQPLTYTITLHDSTRSPASGIGLPTNTVEVHWTRIVHVADNLGSSEIFGIPRMQSVIKHVLDLDNKLYGGSAEMYFRGAMPGLSFETHPQLGGEVDINPEQMRDQVEAYMNGFQRYLALVGMGAKSLSPQVVDPSPQIDKHLEAICIKLGVPMRIFKGSERGELASDQDDAAWNDRLRQRQCGYLTPRVICPVINRLISVGVLPVPKQYYVYWPDLTSQSQEEKSTVALRTTQALAQYVSGGVEAVVPPTHYLTKVIGFTEDETDAIIEDAMALQEEEEREQEEAEAEARAEQDTLEQQPPPPPQSVDGVRVPQPAEGNQFDGRSNVAPE